MKKQNKKARLQPVKTLSKTECKQYINALKKGLELSEQLIAQRKKVLALTHNIGRNAILREWLKGGELWDVIHKYEEELDNLI